MPERPDPTAPERVTVTINRWDQLRVGEPICWTAEVNGLCLNGRDPTYANENGYPTPGAAADAAVKWLTDRGYEVDSFLVNGRRSAKAVRDA